MAYLILLFSACVATVAITMGSWSRLWHTPLRSRWLLVPALGIPIALRFIDLPADRISTVGFGCYIASYGLLLTFCLLNLSVRGMAVVAIGVACNTLVLGLNHGMPTVAVDNNTVTPSVFHNPRASNDLLPILGDAIVVPVTRETISFGDLIIGVGLLNVVYRASRRKRTNLVAEDGEPDATPANEPVLDLPGLSDDATDSVASDATASTATDTALSDTLTPDSFTETTASVSTKTRRRKRRKASKDELPFGDADISPSL